VKQLWVRRDIDAPAAVLWEFDFTLPQGGHASAWDDELSRQTAPDP
jgi:hypothetical protein